MAIAAFMASGVAGTRTSS